MMSMRMDAKWLAVSRSAACRVCRSHSKDSPQQAQGQNQAQGQVHDQIQAQFHGQHQHQHQCRDRCFRSRATRIPYCATRPPPTPSSRDAPCGCLPNSARPRYWNKLPLPVFMLTFVLIVFSPRMTSNFVLLLFLRVSLSSHSRIILFHSPTHSPLLHTLSTLPCCPSGAPTRGPHFARPISLRASRRDPSWTRGVWSCRVCCSRNRPSSSSCCSRWRSPPRPRPSFPSFRCA
jgi:hypothetical protein